MIKCVFLLAAFCTLSVVLHAQRMSFPSTKVENGYRKPANLYTPAVPGSGGMNTTIQQQFNNGMWTRGYVIYSNGQKAENLWLVFNERENNLYFREGKTTMEFVYPVKEFVIGILVGEDTVDVMYRNSYPPIFNNNAQTFYEVLIDGRFQLLRCAVKTNKLYKDTDVDESERSTEHEQFFACLPDGKLVKIKRNKEQILKALPEYADQISKIIKDNNLRVKNLEDLGILFAMMNGG